LFCFRAEEVRVVSESRRRPSLPTTFSRCFLVEPRASVHCVSFYGCFPVQRRGESREM